MEKETARSGIIQADKKTVALIPEIKFGMLTPELLEKIAQVTRKYEIPILKITSAQRIALVGVKPEDVDAVWNDLDMIPGHGLGTGLNYVQSCPGTAVCRLGQRDSLAMGERVHETVKSFGIEAKIKVGVSGCPLSCGEGVIRDIGMFGKKATGWTIQVGGNAGMNARIGDVLAADLEDDQAIEVLSKLMAYYKENMRAKERMYRFIPRMGGIEAVKEALGLN